MPKEIFVRDFLSDQMIEAGKKLIEKLDALQLEVYAAYWSFLDDERVWRLFIVSPLVGTKGPKFFYDQIIALGRQADPEESVISLNDVTGLYTSDSQYQSLASKVSTKNNAISDIHFSRDMYIYRMVKYILQT